MLCRLGRTKEQRICFVWFILCARTHVSVRRRDAWSEGYGVWPVHAHIGAPQIFGGEMGREAFVCLVLHLCAHTPTPTRPRVPGPASVCAHANAYAAVWTGAPQSGIVLEG